MQPKILYLAMGFLTATISVKAQNTFPVNGNVGVGTLAPATNLQVIGKTRTGGTTNYAQFDGGGVLTFKGSAAYNVGGNKYVFRLSSNTNYGLYFNSTDNRYEFLDAIQRPVFHLNADNGNLFIRGGLQLGNTNENLFGNIRWTGSDFEGYDGSSWKSLTGLQSWGLQGNGGTNSTTNFLGTTDAKSLIFRVNNKRSGLIDVSSDQNTSFGYNAMPSSTPGAGVYNTAIGFESLFSNSTGNENTAVGYQTLYSNTTGYNNVAYGGLALYLNSTGSVNTGIGYYSLFSNTIGNQNTGTGFYSIKDNTTGEGNTANGAYSLAGNTAGSGNTAAGRFTLFSNVNGNGNTAMGDSVLYYNKGSYNTGIGSGALSSNYGGSNNVAIGNNALKTNFSGNSLVAVGEGALFNQDGGNGGSTAIGSKALFSNTTGDYNSAIGTRALYSNTTGTGNTASGYYALSSNTTGYSNTAYGISALSTNSTGYQNTLVGYHADVNNGTYNNSTGLGANVIVTASNQVRIGNSSVTSIGGYKAWSNLSDGRYKKNIKENVPGLAFINALKPVTYNLDIQGVNAHLKKGMPAIKDAKGNAIEQSKEDENAIAAVEATLETGFVAQDVEAAAKKLGYQFSGVDAPKNSEDLYGLRYSEFVVPLVKAVQELSKMNNDKEERIKALEERLAKLESGTTSLATTASNSSMQPVEKSATFKIMPNPAQNVLTVSGLLSGGNITITTLEGRQVLQQNVTSNNTMINISSLANGMYILQYRDSKGLQTQRFVKQY